MFPEGRIFLTGTMRTGGSLLINCLSVHSQILILNERVHFFRFVYKRYEPLEEKNIERMLHHQRLRLKYRLGLEIEVEPILKAIKQRGVNYRSIYDEMMKYFLKKGKKKIWGEYAALQWREIPIFLKFFPQGKVIHVLRDPRGVIASWKKLSSLPDNAYLNAIFNWIDSANYVDQYRETLPAETYLPVQYERIMKDPKNELEKICHFLGVQFEETMIHGEQWKNFIGNDLVSIPRSAHEGKDIMGFSTKRTQNWKDNLQEWEIALIEFLCKDKLERYGYDPWSEKYSISTIREGIEALKKNPLLLKHLHIYFSTGEGINQYPTDPTDPKSWGAPHNPSEWFINSPVAKSYFRDMEMVEKMIEEKYATR